MKWIFTIFFSAIFCWQHLHAQQVQADTVLNTRGAIVSGDTVLQQPDSKYQDSLRQRRIKRTILHSTFVPGWGQVNNRQAWKVPLVAAAVGIPVVLFLNNLKEYKALKQAYIYRVDTIAANDKLIPQKYQPLSANSLKYYRDAYRQNVDYSALVFILAWGLNVVDAAVFANLKDFDVNDKLSLKFKPSVEFSGRTNVALIVTFRGANRQRTYTNF